MNEMLCEYIARIPPHALASAALALLHTTTTVHFTAVASTVVGFTGVGSGDKPWVRVCVRPALARCMNPP